MRWLLIFDFLKNLQAWRYKQMKNTTSATVKTSATVESFYFESFLWPIEQVWILGFFLSIPFFFNFFFSRWLDHFLFINWFLTFLFSSSFSLKAAAIKVVELIFEALVYLLNRFGFSFLFCFFFFFLVFFKFECYLPFLYSTSFNINFGC